MSESVGVTFTPGLVEAPSRSFHAGDYVVFALTLAIAAIIGLYIGIKYRKKMTVRELLLGGRNLGILPVSLSLVATVTSTIFVLGVPSETYYGGDWPLYLAFAFIPATIITVHMFIPIFHKLEVTSAYEYIGLRFNNVIRFLAALIYIIMANFTQAISLYTPAVGFSLVAGVSLEISILAAGFICTFYTALGGLRAVVVTDIFQIGTIMAGIIGLLIKGSIDAGGVDKIFKTAVAGRRLQLWVDDWTENTTYSFWAQFFGGTVIFLSLCAGNQQTVQRYCAVKKCSDAQKAAYIAMIFYVITWVLVLFIGLIIYTFYYTCDPLVLDVIYNPDQVLPLFIMDTLGHLHGLPGLFSAAVFGAVLSSVSSGINSLAAVTLEDVIKPVHFRLKKKAVSEEVGRALTRSLALFYGIMTVSFSYLPVKYGTFFSNMEVTFSAFGVLGGPIMGVFLLGTLVPLANSIGAGVGMVVSLLFGMWLWIGHTLCHNTSIPEPVVIAPTDCGIYYNLTGFDPEARRPEHHWPGQGIFKDCPMQEFYDISFLWWGMICMSMTIVIGVVVSALSGGHRGKVLNPDLLCWQRLKKRHSEGRGLWGHNWGGQPKKQKQAKWLNVSANVPLGPNPLIMKSSKYVSTPNQPVIDHSGMLHEPFHMVGPNLVKQTSGDMYSDPDGVLYGGEMPGAQPLPEQPGVLHSEGATSYTTNIIPDTSGAFLPGSQPQHGALDTNPVLNQHILDPSLLQQPGTMIDPEGVLHTGDPGPGYLAPQPTTLLDPEGVLHTGDPGPGYPAPQPTTLLDPEGVLHQPGQTLPSVAQNNVLSGAAIYPGQYNPGFIPDSGLGNPLSSPGSLENPQGNPLGNPGIYPGNPLSPAMLPPGSALYPPGDMSRGNYGDQVLYDGNNVHMSAMNTNPQLVHRNTTNTPALWS